MQIRNRSFALLAAIVLLPFAAAGQSSSINAYSPYSFFGLGDINQQGSSAIRAMGGAGVAIRDFSSINYLNPAAYSAVWQRSALFNVGLEGQNYYLTDVDPTTGQERHSSHNSFNLRDLAFQLPLASGVGLAFSLTPYSSVGYRLHDRIIDGNIGELSRSYTGQGGLNQFKLGVGYEIWKNRLSIGAEVVYFHGNIERNYSLIPISVVGSGIYLPMHGTDRERINSFAGNFGIQAVLMNKNDNVLNLGAVYRMGGRLRGDVTEHIPHSGSTEPVDNAVRYRNNPLSMEMPHTVIVGLNFVRPSYSLALDYTYGTWGAVNSDLTSRDGVSFRNTHAVSFGGEVVPNAKNVRSYLSRCAYRFGVRYSQYYMVFDGNSFDDKAITLGVGFPIKTRNSIDVGIELGTRGTTSHGLVRENYFKFSIGIRLFGDDYWFMKLKYD